MSIDRAKHGGFVGSRYPESVATSAKWFASRLHGGVAFTKDQSIRARGDPTIPLFLPRSLALSFSPLVSPIAPLAPSPGFPPPSFFLPSSLPSFTRRRRRLRPSSSVYNRLRPSASPTVRISFIYLALFPGALPFVSHQPVVPSSAARFFSA